MSEKLISGKLPILALRGLAVFPDQTVHFDVGRKKSVLALDAAMKADQNILLKVVEEGPAYAAFVFCAENASQVLQTLRSRCVEWKLQMLRFLQPSAPPVA